MEPAYALVMVFFNFIILSYSVYSLDSEALSMCIVRRAIYKKKKIVTGGSYLVP